MPNFDAGLLVGTLIGVPVGIMSLAMLLALGSWARHHGER